jgi:DNA-binding transcriptional LysR family regulator
MPDLRRCRPGRHLAYRSGRHDGAAATRERAGHERSQALREAVLGGAGIALLPTFVVGEDIRTGLLVHVLPAVKPVGMFGSHILAVYRENRFLPQKVRVFIDFLLERLGGHPPWDAFLHYPKSASAR